MTWKVFYKYKISENGDVYSLKHNRLLKCRVSRKGYKTCLLTLDGEEKGFQIHRLVYMLFVGNLNETFDIHHIDENKLNNVYTNLEKIEHKTHTSLHKLGSKWIDHIYKKKEKVLKDRTLNKTYDMDAYQKAYQKNYRSIRQNLIKK